MAPSSSFGVDTKYYSEDWCVRFALMMSKLRAGFDRIGLTVLREGEGEGEGNAVRRCASL